MKTMFLEAQFEKDNSEKIFCCGNICVKLQQHTILMAQHSIIICSNLLDILLCSIV